MNQIQPRTNSAPVDLCDAPFDNSFVRELPGDPLLHNVSRAVADACYTRVNPTPVAAPTLLGWSETVGATLGITRPHSATGRVAEVLGGNLVLPGMAPYAARYGGHQFGHWAGQLGDGRAITLTELLAPDGRRYDIQLKGAGRTPYSRTADGRAVLRSSVREFMCSEAMHWLGVPTTRALSLVSTGDAVVRDMFYDGNPEAEPGAIVCRVAPSFVRFGNFELLAAQKENDTLKRLVDYVITTHFPELGAPSIEVYGQWFQEICRRTATLMVEWMRVGFVHGVMNTDNMSILGLTIDYGPYGWLEGYDPRWTPNTTDAQGRRYCYGNQPNIGQWNIVRLANALYPLIGEKEPLEAGIGMFVDTFESASARMLCGKLGLSTLDREGDDQLVGDLYALLGQTETDVTLFFRGLGTVRTQDAGALDDTTLVAPLAAAFYSDTVMQEGHAARVAAWLRRYAVRTTAEGVPDTIRSENMNRVNPKYVLRNYLAQQSIDALAAGDDAFMNRLMRVLERPYDEQPEESDLAARRPEWARHKPGCSALSCSS